MLPLNQPSRNKPHTYKVRWSVLYDAWWKVKNVLIKKQKIMEEKKEKKAVKFSIDFENQTVTLYEGYYETVLSKNELDALLVVRNLLLFRENADYEK